MSAKKLIFLLTASFFGLALPFRAFAQVSLQTGSAVFSLPMFDWKDTKGRLASSVAISYSSGNGLKVNDLASDEGQGWNLVAGGAITRMQVGEPDDQPLFTGAYSSWNDQDITKIPPGYLYDTIPIPRGCPNALTKYPTYGAKNVLYAQHPTIGEDRQLDYFSFQFNGKTGMFILDTSGGIWHGIPLGDTRMLITLKLDNTMAASQGIRTTITSFTITDVDGLIYKFAAHGLTRLLTAGFSNQDGSKPEQQPNINNQGVYAQSGFDNGPTAAPWTNPNMAYPYIISNWYLTEVDDPFTGRKISYLYHARKLITTAGAEITYNNSDKQYVVVSYNRSSSIAMDIDSVTYPDGHGIKFKYASSQRFDLPGDTALAAITISYNGRYVSQYQLNTTYGILGRLGNPSDAYEQTVARLYLHSIRKIGPDLKEDQPPYQFDYFTSSGSGNNDDFIPPPFYYVKDIWGYYNGNNSIASNSPLTGSGVAPVNLWASNPYQLSYYALKGLCFQNDNVTGTYYNAKAGYAQNGLLRQVIYPTGGSLTYAYAQDTGSFILTPSTIMPVGGVHVSKTSSVDGGYSNGCSNPVVTNYNYVMNGPGSASSMWGLETPVNSTTSTNSWKDEKPTIHVTWYLAVSCKWHYIYPGILNRYESVSLDVLQKIMVVASTVMGVIATVTTVLDVINMICTWTSFTIISVIIDIIVDVISLIISCGQQTQFTTDVMYYDFDLNGMAPLPAQFKRVEITESSGTIGKTVQQFTQGDVNDPGGMDYPLWFAPGSNVALSSKQRYAPWAYGLPKLTQTYDVNGNLIKQVRNVYDFTYAKEQILDTPGGCQWNPVVGCKCNVINNYSQRSDVWASAIQYGNPLTYLTTSPDMHIDFDTMYTGHVNLDTTYERTYRTTDVTQYVQQETDYSYNNGSFGVLHNCANMPNNFDLNQVVTKQSNGDAVYKNILYSADFRYQNLLDTLVNHNMYSVPVAYQTYVIKSGSFTPMYLSEKVTEFTRLADNDIAPLRHIEQRFAAPTSSFTPYPGPATANYSNYEIPMTFTYDVNSNLIGRQDEGNRFSTDIYDSCDMYVVAAVINANPTTDHAAYTSFERMDLTRSGWTLSGPPMFNRNSPSATGSSNFTLLSSGGNSLSASTLNTATAYTLSYWATNGNVTVTGGATLTKSAPTYNGYTYFEYSIAAGTSGVTLKNNAASAVNIDELRLYPVNARIKTMTFDPILGRTSECDDNNRITYYAYDNLGRLQFEKDESQNILKMHEYNNVSAAKQAGCPSEYFSHMISEPIARTNCGLGYVGDTVRYIVPATQFQSYISQLDADLQAEIYFLTNYQSYANTNGACSPIYYNVVESQADTSQNCAPGYKGGPVTYTVPAGTYSSIISQADANQQALTDIAANAQSYANLPGNQNCLIDTAADWEWNVGDPNDPAGLSYCLSVNGQLPPHLFVQMQDMNPNSAHYGQTMWVDDGPSSACPANTYYNAQASQAFTKNNCPSGYSGTTVTYTVPPGEYSSTASQAAANQLATNDINANGQNYANTNGSCVGNCSIVAEPGFATISTNISSTSTTTTFTLIFNSTGQTNWNSSNLVAAIQGTTCMPSTTQVFNVTSATPAGTVWRMTVTSAGQISIILSSGTAPNSVVQFTNVSFNK